MKWLPRQSWFNWGILIKAFIFLSSIKSDLVNILLVIIDRYVMYVHTWIIFERETDQGDYDIKWDQPTTPVKITVHFLEVSAKYKIVELQTLKVSAELILFMIDTVIHHRTQLIPVETSLVRFRDLIQNLNVASISGVNVGPVFKFSFHKMVI